VSDFSFNPTFGNNEMRILSRPRGRGYILAPLRLAPLRGSIRMISVTRMKSACLAIYLLLITLTD